MSQDKDETIRELRAKLQEAQAKLEEKPEASAVVSDDYTKKLIIAVQAAEKWYQVQLGTMAAQSPTGIAPS